MNPEEFRARGATEPVNPTDNDILNDPDAMHWAEYFIHIRRNRLEQDGVDIAEDAGTMVGWFANAMQRGEWSSPHYKAWLEEYMKGLIQRDDDDLSSVGTNREDYGKPHNGGQHSVPVVTAQDWRRMFRDKQQRKETPLFVIQYDDRGNQLLVTDVDESRLKKKGNN